MDYISTRFVDSSSHFPCRAQTDKLGHDSELSRATAIAVSVANDGRCAVMQERCRGELTTLLSNSTFSATDWTSDTTDSAAVTHCINTVVIAGVCNAPCTPVIGKWLCF